MNLEERSNYIFDKAKSLGAEQSEVIYSSSKTLSLKAQEGKLEEYKVSDSHVLGVRIVKNNQIGICYSEDLDQQSLDHIVKEAITNASFSKVDEYESIQADSKNVQEKNLTIEQTVDQKECIDFSLKLEEDTLKAHEKTDSAPYNGFSEVSYESLLMNSLGAKCRINDKYFSYYTSSLMKDGDKNAIYYDSEASREFHKLSPKKLIQEVTSTTHDLLTASEIKSGKYHCIFTSDILAQIFGQFSSIFSAKSTLNKVNPFADKLGKSIASSNLTLVDDPYIEIGLDQNYFDSEGYLTQKNTLIENGVFKTFLHNSATAKELGMSNTFNAGRSPKGQLGISGNMKQILGTDLAEEKLQKEKHLFIVNIQGLGPGSNFSTGDFSFGASGYLYENGENKGCYKNFTVAGNFYELLKDLQVADKVHSNSGKSFFAPRVLFPSLTIGGS